MDFERVYLRCPACGWVSVEWIGYCGPAGTECRCGLSVDQLVECGEETAGLPPLATAQVVRRNNGSVSATGDEFPTLAQVKGAESEVVFLDCEASGLHRGSYPIEVGWANPTLQSGSFLIRPALHWCRSDWSVQSERIHGITRDECMRDGVDVEQAAERLNSALAGKAIFSDAPEFDGAWLHVLFSAARIEPAFPLRLLNALELIKGAADDRGLSAREREERELLVRLHYPRAHRAVADAVHLAALYRVMSDEGFLGAWRRR